MNKFRFTNETLSTFDKTFTLTDCPTNGAWFYKDESVDYYEPDYTGERSATDTGLYHKSFNVLVGLGGVLEIGDSRKCWTYVPEADMTVSELIKVIKEKLHN